MKILYSCAAYQIGHLYYDSRMVKILSNVGELHVLSPKNWIDFNNDKIQVHENATNRRFSKFPHINQILVTLTNYRRINKLSKKMGIDAIVLGEFELITIRFFLRFCKKPVYLLYHYNVDQIDRKKHFKKVFDKIKNNVHHVVFESFIYNHLLNDHGVDKSSLHLWSHPLERDDDVNSVFSLNKKYDCIGLGNNNDKAIVSRFIEMEETNKVFKDSNLKAVFKAQDLEYDDGYLTVINKRLDDETFDNYYKNTKSVFVLYPDSYKYRVSGIVFDSIRKHIPVVGTSSLIVSYYKDKYPNIFYIFKDNLIEQLNEINHSNKDLVERDFKKFFDDHSDNTIQKQIEDSLFRQA